MTAALILALAVTPSVLLERGAGGGVFTRVLLNGEPQIAMVEALNGEIKLREDLAANLPIPYRIQIGDFWIELLSRDIPTEKSFGDDLDRRGVVAFLNEAIFRNVMVGADYLNNSFVVIPKEDKSSADRWVREGAEGLDLVRMKLRPLGKGVFAFSRFRVDGRDITVAPLLLGFQKVIHTPFEPTHLSRGARSNTIRDGSSVRFSMWKDVRVGDIQLMRFWGGYRTSSPPKEDRASGTFPLGALGPRRIVWDPDRSEIIFVRPTRDEMLEALLREDVMSFSVDISGDRIFAGRPAVLDKARENSLTGSPIVSIGGVETARALQALRGTEQERDGLLQEWLEMRSARTFSFIVRVNGQNVQVNIR